MITEERREIAKRIETFAKAKVPANWGTKVTAKDTIELGDRGVGGVYKLEIDPKNKVKFILPASNMTLSPDEYDKAIKYTEECLKCMKELQAVEQALKKAKLVKEK